MLDVVTSVDDQMKIERPFLVVNLNPIPSDCMRFIPSFQTVFPSSREIQIWDMAAETYKRGNGNVHDNNSNEIFDRVNDNCGALLTKIE